MGGAVVLVLVVGCSIEAARCGDGRALRWPREAVAITKQGVSPIVTHIS